jgi:acyl-coenzyme A synthetase/AMP-(fatty) acid ligase
VEISTELDNEEIKDILSTIANPDLIQWASGLPETPTGNIMSRVLPRSRKT